MPKKELVFSVTANDCEWQYFRVGGNGGQHRDKTSSGVRVIHHPSGARAEATEDRSQLRNRKAAFKRMTETIQFKTWLNRRLVQGPTAEELVERDMQPHKLRVEGRDTGTWAEIQ